MQKPAFNPPNWVFPPVWTVLYVLMAFSAWRVWKRDGLTAAIVLWVVQLLFNAAWMWLFFGLHRPEAGLVEILILLVLIVMLTYVFWRRDRLAGILLVPYVAWVAYAALVNYALWQLNPAA
ncbi:benzodiazapine receptor [Paraburkholderia sp. WC7.3g]|uniref:TspO/MBR family protein n=1 Tax=Paraburkholderia sp. WC7.3g TaxID=2991070 RepID=UPI003D257F30